MKSLSESRRSIIQRPNDVLKLVKVCKNLARKLQRPQEFSEERGMFIREMKKWMTEEEWKEK